ncbi:hemerythrin domain-containing protein [Actinoplanes sp. NPDC051633]|uniref:hemerythrin domain-containing protein n=1 Tax=Actinoplanes sp. NPDC051633 TaxID=3155670 RepID=UPI003434A11D
MTNQTVRERPDTHDMYVVHRVFRRESALMPRLVRAVRPGDIARARRVAEHFRGYALGLHHHHTGEDELIWPLLLARVDLEAELVLRMEEQHSRVANGLATVTDLLPSWERTASSADGERIAVALEEHASALAEHLADEEDHLLALIEEHLTVAEYGALNERFAAETPKDKLLLFLGALLEEATPEETADITRNLPLPAKLAWWLIGRRQYARQARELRAPLTAGVW